MQVSQSIRRAAITLAIVALFATMSPRTDAYVEIPYTLGRLINESTVVCLMRVDKVDKQKNLIIYKKIKDIKGQHPADEIKHDIGQRGFHPREWQTIMAWAEVGKTALFFHNGGASETCIDGYWYQAYAGDWWGMSHAEPYLLRTYYGKPEKLATLVTQMLAGQEVIAPCMIDGDKNAIQLRTAKIQRLRASLKLVDYDAKRDFVGWGGNDEFRRITGMPGFSHFGALPRVDPYAGGVAPADIDGDGKIDLCLYGEMKTVLLKNDGNMMNESSLPYSGGARAAAWADYNGDGKPDLLLATPTGPKLFTNQGDGTFKDDSRGLPVEPYYNVTTAAWIDADGDKRPDILLGNGFLGLRLYRNLGPDAPAKPTAPRIGPWYTIGPFDNRGGQGFDRVFEPEKRVDVTAELVGKDNRKIKWQKKDFVDGQVNALTGLFGDDNESVAYVYREFNFGAAVDVPVSLGSDDSLCVFLNGERIVAENTARAAAPDQNMATLHLKAGKNELLLKIGQGSGDWAFYFAMKGEAQTPVAPLFEDATTAMNLGPGGIGGAAKGDRVVVADFSGDGRDDFLYTAGTGVVALGSPNGFVEAKQTGITFKSGGVTPIFGDYDGDKKPDLLIPQRTGSRLFLNIGNGRFLDVTGNSGDLANVKGEVTAAAWADFNKTGQPDLIISVVGGPNRYLRNVGGGRFVDAGAERGFDTRIFNSRGVAAIDLNGDGAIDLVFNNEGQDPALFVGDPNVKSASR